MATGFGQVFYGVVTIVSFVQINLCFSTQLDTLMSSLFLARSRTQFPQRIYNLHCTPIHSRLALGYSVFLRTKDCSVNACGLRI